MSKAFTPGKTTKDEIQKRRPKNAFMRMHSNNKAKKMLARTGL
jgi:hypothetical protein